MTDQTGLIAFTGRMIAREKAEAADLPEGPRRLLERTLVLLEAQLAEHGPDSRERVHGEPLCTGCLVVSSWPCDFALSAAAIWWEDQGFQLEWRDALNPLAHAEGL